MANQISEKAWVRNLTSVLRENVMFSLANWHKTGPQFLYYPKFDVEKLNVQQAYASMLCTNSDPCEEDDDFTLHQLNDHCLLKIFEYLSLGDVKRLGKTSARLKDLALIRCHKFTFQFHSGMWCNENGDKLLNDFLLEYGEHIRSWSLTMDDEIPNSKNSAENILKNVSQYSKNLISLTFNRFYHGPHGPRFVRDCQVADDCFDNVELLSFKRCNLLNDSDFLQRFRKLKHLRVLDECVYDRRDLQIMFRNNPGLESFVADINFDDNFIRSFNLYEFGPKFDKLCIHIAGRIVEMDLLLRLAATNLTKLRLDMHTLNLGIFLQEMSKKGILKELELRNVQLNRSEFDTLQLFENLELLVLGSDHPSICELDSTSIWPRHLKHLALNVPITEDGLISLIRQLKCLTRLQFKPVTDGGLNISDLHGNLENIVKECLTRPTLSITIHPRMTYIVDYEATTVSCTNEIISDYIRIA